MSTNEIKRPRGRPPKKKTLEQEAQEFLKKDKEDIPPSNVKLGEYFAGCALSGLIASGKYLRSDEIVDEAYKYRDRMLEANKNKK